MDKKKVCLYQLLNKIGGPSKTFAYWPRRREFNCPACKRDKGNDNCPYFKEVAPMTEYGVDDKA